MMEMPPFVVDSGKRLAPAPDHALIRRVDGRAEITRRHCRAAECDVILEDQ
jgi:hypothetical protein